MSGRRDLVSTEEAWEDDLRRRYPEDDSGFRSYEDASDTVRDFYRLNHSRQTVDFVRAIRHKYLPLRTREMGVWEAFSLLNDLVDESDPDTENAQTAHAMQTAEAIRADGHPDWFILTGLIHDLGKVLCLFGEPQWAVTGDTFPVGCAYSAKIVLPEFFTGNPDSDVPEYQTLDGIYEPGCGLNDVLMSWGHDEYLYHVVQPYLPVEAQYMIRYHSFYAGHREGEYQHLMNDTDHEMFAFVRAFNSYDLYTKHDVPPDVNRLMPYYEELVTRFFPNQLQW